MGLVRCLNVFHQFHQLVHRIALDKAHGGELFTALIALQADVNIGQRLAQQPVLISL
jgi:hypothetical protein